MNDDAKKAEPELADFLNFAPGVDDIVGTAGSPLPEGETIASEEAMIEAIQTVYDPEIPVNLYDLGLIYRLEIDAKGDVEIDMTLTAPGCPVAHEMPVMVANAVSAVPGTGEITVRLVWDPPWSQDRMTEAARLELGLI